MVPVEETPVSSVALSGVPAVPRMVNVADPANSAEKDGTFSLLIIVSDTTNTA